MSKKDVVKYVIDESGVISPTDIKVLNKSQFNKYLQENKLSI